ncbi:MAG: hypothetical protein QOH61_2519, partial [Chloroflexota bacterium]|nr:hypothetical protein [Chloroflexota bacterium]
MKTQSAPGSRPRARQHDSLLRITERQRGAADLAASEERFRLLAERSQDIVFRVRVAPERVLEYISAASTRLTGYTPGELYADPHLWPRLIHPDDRVLLNRDLASPVQSEEPVVVRWIRKDGSTLWAEHRSVRVVDAHGSLVAVEGVARDVTARVEAETLLHASERDRTLLTAAFEQTTDAVIVTDVSNTVVFVNSAFLRASGSRREDVIGTLSPFLEPGAQEPAAFEHMWATLGAGEAWHGDLDSQRTDGSGYTEAVTITPVYDAQGALSAYISVQRDVSHMREVEADLVLEAAVRALLGQAIRAAASSSSLEEAAHAVCEGLASLPGIHYVNLVAFLGANEAVVIACRPADGMALQPGDRLPEDHARYLHVRAASGPWGERRGSSL